MSGAGKAELDPMNAGLFAQGFEIETELTGHALTLDLPVEEIDSEYRSRPDGSASKLRTFRDGAHVIGKILQLIRTERPLLFFSAIGSVLIAAAIVLAYPMVVEFIETGLVPRFPTAILATGLTISGLISVASAFILDAVTLSRREAKRLAYSRGR